MKNSQKIGLYSTSLLSYSIRLFFHNFLKENNLLNTTARYATYLTLFSFENEVLQQPNFQHDLPIKSNKTILFEWWNIFFYLYSEKMIQVFKERNRNNFRPELLNSISMKELFKGSMNNNFLNANDARIETMPPFSRISPLTNQMIHSQIYEPNINKIGMNQGVYAPQGYQSQMVPDPRSIPITPTLIENNSQEGSQMNYLLKRPEMKVEKSHKLFNTSNVDNGNNNPTQQSSSPFQTLPNEDLLAKKRKRYIKNNKLVFVQPGSAAAKKLELEGADKEEEITKLENNEEMFDQNVEYNSTEEQISKGKKPRGSRYRGVSRNGNQRQVLIMVNKKKRYVGSYSNEEEAARAYDKVALQNHGAKAKTNFDYLEEEVQKILGDPPLLKLTS